MNDLLDTAKQAVKLAKDKGANDASASAYRSRQVELVWRDGKVEKVSEATTRGLSISLYVDGRYSSVSTSDLRPEALSTFVEESIVMARSLSRDEYRRLPDPKLYEGRADVDLMIHDPRQGDVSPDERKRIAADLEASARSHEKSSDIVSVTTSVSDSESMSARATSNGFEGERRSTTFYMDASVTAKDPDGRRPDGYDSRMARFASELGKPDDVGRRATERAVGAIGAAKIASTVTPLIVENRVAGRLLRALLGPLGGRALQQKQSFLEGQIGASIASELLTVTDDPLLQKGFGSRLYDGDGIAAKKRSIIAAGVLESYFIDDYYGRKLELPPTSAGSSNLIFGLGKKSLDELLHDANDGILVTSFLGGNSNATTGDYSLGIQGYRVEKGVRTTPIAEMNIAGNQKDLWKKLSALGNDPYPYSSMRSPSLVFDGVQFAGG